MTRIHIVFLLNIAALIFIGCFPATMYAIPSSILRVSIPDPEESKKINEQKNENAQSNDDYLKWHELNEKDRENGASTIIQQRMPGPNDMTTSLSLYESAKLKKTSYAISIIDDVRMVSDWIIQQFNNLINQIQEFWQQILQTIQRLIGK